MNSVWVGLRTPKYCLPGEFQEKLCPKFAFWLVCFAIRLAPDGDRLMQMCCVQREAEKETGAVGVLVGARAQELMDCAEKMNWIQMRTRFWRALVCWGQRREGKIQGEQSDW